MRPLTSRPHRARGTLVLTALLAAGCQDYNFNPVGHCLIQPGTRRVELSNLSSADVLFVVDDSGSMGGEQAALADNFGAFISNLDGENEVRAGRGQTPIDFHIAVTSTSVLWNQYTRTRPSGPYTCRSDCTGAAGQLVCCRSTGTPAIMAKKCESTAECSAGTTCNTNCISPYANEAALRGEKYCCVEGATTITTAYPTGYQGDLIPCSRAGVECGTFESHYDFSGCGASGENGVAVNGWPYPQGDFVSFASGASANPRVLHFDKELYPSPPNPAATNRQGFTRQQLVDFFAGVGGVGGNVKVGTCGSGQEQALAAARMAIEKARDGLQTDTYARTGTGTGTLVPQPTWTPRSANGQGGTATSTADWFAAGASSKLVVVFVGDEDDCSTPTLDPSGSVVWDFAGDGDTCVSDSLQKLQTVQSFVDFLTGLGRPVAAGFILPAAQTTCSLQTCTADALCCPAGGCGSNLGAQARGVRLLQTAQALSARGVEVVAGSICDGNFGTILDEIAQIVKPPTSLTLPTQPAATDVTLLRIEADGETRKICSRPAPDDLTFAQASAATGANGEPLYDWWFTDGPTGNEPGPTSRYVYINQTGRCIANPGEAYSADYLGKVPAGGCWDNPDAAYAPDVAAGETRGDAMCRKMLGGNAGSWTCYTPAAAGACGTPTGSGSTGSGTCICGSRAQNCGG